MPTCGSVESPLIGWRDLPLTGGLLSLILAVQSYKLARVRHSILMDDAGLPKTDWFKETEAYFGALPVGPFGLVHNRYDLEWVLDFKVAPEMLTTDRTELPTRFKVKHFASHLPDVQVHVEAYEGEVEDELECAKSEDLSVSWADAVHFLRTVVVEDADGLGGRTETVYKGSGEWYYRCSHRVIRIIGFQGLPDEMVAVAFRELEKEARSRA